MIFLICVYNSKTIYIKKKRREYRSKNLNLSRLLDTDWLNN